MKSAMRSFLAILVLAVLILVPAAAMEPPSSPEEKPREDTISTQAPSDSPPRAGEGPGERSTPLGAARTSRIETREKQTTDDFVPMPDRWRIGFPSWDRYGPGGDAPYRRGRWWNPYRQNVLKGDYPIRGQNTFLNLTLSSDTFLGVRRLPTPGGVSAERPGSAAFFGRSEEFALAQGLLLSLDLFHGDTAYKPRDWAFRLTPVFNGNVLRTREQGGVAIDVRRGSDRTDAHPALQELFGEVKLADLSPRYDFLSLRGGIQGFTSDFRGFLFSDNAPGLRLFGNARANRNQWNVAVFSLLEKDTNSGLNTLRARGQEVAVANFYRQDLFRQGYTGSLSLHYSRDHGARHYDENGFLVRPAPIGTVRDHDVRVWYLGWAGDGHLGALNVSHAFYQAWGKDERNPIAGRRVYVNAQFAAVELSIDRDWLRFKGSLLWASGDDRPTDGRGRGFDAILDNPVFAGGPFSFWGGQGIRLTGTGVALVGPASFLPTLRSSKLEGQANFVNPGLFLYNIGVDAEVTPKVRASFNLNALQFAKTEPLALALNQGRVRRGIGWDVGMGVRYRPHLNDNIVLIFGASALAPGHGFRDLFTNQTLYALFSGVTLTY
jgi:hypothetical protein